MTLSAILVIWAVESVVCSLALGRWLGGRDRLDRFIGPVRFRLDDD